MKSINPLRVGYAVALALLLVLAGCGKTPEATQGQAQSDREAPHEHAKQHLDPSYVCPMHPQVASSEPGECPICGMDLVAKEAEAAPAAMAAAEEVPPISVSDAVVNQLGVRTAEVRRGTLHRHVECPGVFLRSTSNATLLVVGQVFEREAPLVRVGQTVRVRFPNLGAREWTGTVTSLETQVSQTSHTLQFRVSADRQGATVPGGMTAIVRVEVDPVADVLLVPREAVIVTGKGARVVVAQGGGRFQPREVEAEDLGGDEIAIRSGLGEGDRVVVSAQFLLDSEANLQAGLRRLTGGHAGAEGAPEGSLHVGAMPDGIVQAETVQEEPLPEGTVPAPTVQEGTVPEATVQEGAMPEGPTHEGTMQ
jgi:multidrug efflux pump subunit AcrA (membrane-fusion protein)